MDVLSIPAVLQTVLGNLDNKNVGNCRLVNTFWNEEACKILESRVLISFHTCLDLMKFNETCESSLAQLSISFQNFYFSSDLFISAAQDFPVPSLPKLEKELQRFVQLVGDQVTHLKLVVIPILTVSSGRERYTTMMYKQMLEMIYNYFPNLQELKLLFIPSTGPPLVKGHIECDDLDWQISDSCGLEAYAKTVLTKLQSVQLDVHIPNQWGNFLEGYGNASELELRMISAFIRLLLSSSVNLHSIGCTDIPPHPFLQHCLLKSLPSMKSSFQLQKLIPITNCSDNLLTLLRSGNFPSLDTVYLEIVSENVRSEDSSIKDFFLRYKSSLRKLHLNFCKPSCKSLQVPLEVTMKSLHWLTLEQFQGSIKLGNLPALKRLTLNHSSVKGISAAFKLPTQISIESLEIIEGVLDSEQDFKSIFTVTPTCLPYLSNLTITKVSCRLPLEIIFTECKKLKSLTIKKCCGVTDQALCGIRDRLLSLVCPVEISEHAAQTEELDKAFKKMVIGTGRNPSVPCAREFAGIGNLKDLQFLNLEGEFSDVGVLYGVILCDALIRVNLKSKKCSWRSVRIIQQASLDHLISAEINGENVFRNGSKEIKQ